MVDNLLSPFNIQSTLCGIHLHASTTTTDHATSVASRHSCTCPCHPSMTKSIRMSSVIRISWAWVRCLIDTTPSDPQFHTTIHSIWRRYPTFSDFSTYPGFFDFFHVSHTDSLRDDDVMIILFVAVGQFENNLGMSILKDGKRRFENCDNSVWMRYQRSTRSYRAATRPQE